MKVTKKVCSLKVRQRQKDPQDRMALPTARDSSGPKEGAKERWGIDADRHAGVDQELLLRLIIL